VVWPKAPLPNRKRLRVKGAGSRVVPAEFHDVRQIVERSRDFLMTWGEDSPAEWHGTLEEVVGLGKVACDTRAECQLPLKERDERMLGPEALVCERQRAGPRNISAYDVAG
jgi:hypothetical protein